MDKNKQSNSIYPSATRGVLSNEQTHKKYQTTLNRSRDSSPASLIFQAVVIVIIIGVLGIGSYVYYLTRIKNETPKTVAYAVAKRFAEQESSKTYYDQLELDTQSVLNMCEAPVITITYDYGNISQANQRDTTVIQTNKVRELAPVLDEIVTKADGSIKNTYEVVCPVN